MSAAPSAEGSPAFRGAPAREAPRSTGCAPLVGWLSQHGRSLRCVQHAHTMPCFLCLYVLLARTSASLLLR